MTQFDPAGARGASIIRRLEALAPNRIHRRARLGVGAATFFDAFDTLAIASALPVLVREWSLTPAQVAILISAAFWGQLIGAVVFSWIAEKFGRLLAVSYSVGLFGLMSIGCALAGGVWWLAAARFIQGIGLGGEIPVAASYVNEIIQARIRGRFVILYETLFPLGLLISAIVGSLVIPHFGWQSIFLIASAPTLIALFLRRSLPESPRWLVSKGRLDEADAAVRVFEQAAVANTPVTHEQPIAVSAKGGFPDGPRDANWFDVFRVPLRRRTFVVLTVWIVGGSLTTIMTTLFPTIYASIYGASVQSALNFGVLTMLGGLIGSIACALLIDRLGRRYWMCVAFACVGLVATAMLAWTLRFGAPPIMVLGAFVALAYMFVSGAFITAYAYTPEVYPTHLRTYGTGTASASLRIASGLTPLVVAAFLPFWGLWGYL